MTRWVVAADKQLHRVIPNGTIPVSVSRTAQLKIKLKCVMRMEGLQWGQGNISIQPWS